MWSRSRSEGAQYSDGRPHRLELWRHGRAFLHRRTDDSLDLYVVASGRAGDYDYRFFDHRRHLVTGVKRDNLYRIGVFSDWFGLAHVVERPKVAFEVRAATGPNPGGPRRDCVWRLSWLPSRSSRRRRSSPCRASG